MNVREEDRQKNNCPSRGLGLAAAAIGVGVGAALYYFFSKRPENPDGEGSTTSGWSCEQPHAFHHMHEDSTGFDTSAMPLSAHNSHDVNEDSYLTISEHSTTDTSVYDSIGSEDEYEEYTPTSSDVDEEESDEMSYSEDLITNEMLSSEMETGYQTLPSINVNSSLESEGMEWDVTTSSIGVPEDSMRSPRSPLRSLIGNLETLITPSPRRRTTEDEQMAILRDQALFEEEQLKLLREQTFRERSWSLEECSICFDIILKDQQVTSLPCTHQFHSACITPWLQEQRTCPNCRKAAE